MTLSPWIIYLWGIADKLTPALTISGIVLSFFALGTWSYINDAYSNKANYPSLYKNLDPDAVSAKMSPLIKRFLYPGIVCFILALLTPSSNTVAVMVVAPAIVNSEPIQNDLPELYKAAKEALMNTLTQK